MYDLTSFQNDLKNMKPRVFDTYLLPGFICYYAWASKGMPKAARRIMFIAGVYMGMRSYGEYKALVTGSTDLVTAAQPTQK